jgi:hypothetical protein
VTVFVLAAALAGFLAGGGLSGWAVGRVCRSLLAQQERLLDRIQAPELASARLAERAAADDYESRDEQLNEIDERWFGEQASELPPDPDLDPVISAGYLSD